MWIFNCDRCNKEDKSDIEGIRQDGEYAASLTIALKTEKTILSSAILTSRIPSKFDLCSSCLNNFEWWLQKIDSIVPKLSSPPLKIHETPDDKTPVIQELDGPQTEPHIP